jgi:predicted TIM-barrel fold metal-dependent hydrolase
LIESFGFDRLTYASDWPVSDQTHRYPTWVAILDDLTASCSAAERPKLFHENALGFYLPRIKTAELLIHEPQ